MAPPTAKVLVQFGWTTWHAQAVSLMYMTVDIVDGETMIVHTVRTPVWSVRQSVW